MKKYFLHDSKEQSGPYSIDELKSIGISSETMIWYEGLDKWTAAKNISELKELLKASPPPFEKNSPINETFEKAKKVLDKDIVNEIEGNIKNKRQRKIFKWSILILAIIGLIVVAKFIFFGTNNTPYTNFDTIINKPLKPSALDSLAVINNSGSIYTSYYSGQKEILLRGELLNKSSVYSYKDFIIQVEYYSETDTKLDSTQQYTIYESVNPFQKKYLEKRLAGPAPQGATRLKWKLLNATGYKYDKENLYN